MSILSKVGAKEKAKLDAKMKANADTKKKVMLGIKSNDNNTNINTKP